ncbi:unnamed protein product [Urochloa humidicola]
MFLLGALLTNRFVKMCWQEQGRSGSEDLTVQLVESITSGTNNGARKQLQSLISGLLSLVYRKNLSGLNKGSLYQICRSCLSSLVELFVEDSRPVEGAGQSMTVSGSQPMIKRINKQTENLNWLFDILVNNDMAEEFVELWAKQDELIRMHEQASLMIRYELSRIISKRVHCSGERKNPVSQRYEELVLWMVQANANGLRLAAEMLQRP